MGRYGHVNDSCDADSWQLLEAPSPGRSNAALVPSGESPRMPCFSSATDVATDTAALLRRIQSSATMLITPPPPSPAPCTGGDTRRPGSESTSVADSTATPTDLCIADVNGDGQVAVEDLLLILGAFGINTCSPSAPLGADATDINADCLVDVADLLLCLGAFAREC